MVIKSEIITAHQAKQIEFFNPFGVKDLNKNKVEQYRDLMIEGKWSLFYNGTSKQLIHDPLIFIGQNKLFEGKHRISALAKMPDDFKAEFWVLRDFNREHIDIFKRWHKNWQLVTNWR